jgi:hypothetical protein
MPSRLPRTPSDAEEGLVLGILSSAWGRVGDYAVELARKRPKSELGRGPTCFYFMYQRLSSLSTLRCAASRLDDKAAAFCRVSRASFI